MLLKRPLAGTGLVIDRDNTSLVNIKTNRKERAYSMIQIDTIQKLKEKASADPVTKQVLEEWAARERARSVVTTSSLYQRLKKKGIHYEVNQLREFLAFLSSLNLGKIDSDAKGRVRGLKDIRFTLQSIGKAAINGDTDVKSFKKRNKFSKMAAPTELRFNRSAPPPPQIQTAESTRILKTLLTVFINGKPLSIPIPENFTSSDVLEVMNKFVKQG